MDLKTAFEGVWTSFIRTAIPILVSAIVGFFVKINIPLGDDFANALSTALSLLAGAAFAGLYYLAVRIIEKYKPKAGALLGSTKQPVYTTPEKVPAVEQLVGVSERHDIPTT